MQGTVFSQMPKVQCIAFEWRSYSEKELGDFIHSFVHLILESLSPSHPSLHPSQFLESAWMFWFCVSIYIMYISVKFCIVRMSPIM